MENFIFHLLPSDWWIPGPQYDCGRGRGELPEMSGTSRYPKQQSTKRPTEMEEDH